MNAIACESTFASGFGGDVAWRVVENDVERRVGGIEDFVTLEGK